MIADGRCGHSRAALLALLEDRLPGASHPALAGCPDCQAAYDQYRQDEAALRDFVERAPWTPVAPEVRQQLHGQRRMRGLWRVVGSGGRMLALAAQLTVLVVVLGTLGLILRSARGDDVRVGQPGESTPRVSAETVAVVRAFEAAVDAHDVEAVMALIADDAVVDTNYGNRASYRLWVEVHLGNAPRVLEVGEPEVGSLFPGEVRWKVRLSTVEYTKLGLESLELLRSALIQDGKIKRLNSYYTAETELAVANARLRRGSSGE